MDFQLGKGAGSKEFFYKKDDSSLTNAGIAAISLKPACAIHMFWR